MKIQIGIKHGENLGKAKDLAKLAIGESRDSSLIHICRDHDAPVMVLIAPYSKRTFCYECGKEVRDGTLVMISDSSGKEIYFFHNCHLF